VSECLSGTEAVAAPGSDELSPSSMSPGSPPRLDRSPGESSPAPDDSDEAPLHDDVPSDLLPPDLAVSSLPSAESAAAAATRPATGKVHTHLKTRDVKASWLMWPRGQIIRPRPHSFWPRPRSRPYGIWPRPHRNGLVASNIYSAHNIN